MECGGTRFDPLGDEAHWLRFYREARRLVSRWKGCVRDSDEVVQEAIVRILVRAGTRDSADRSTEAAWLWGVLRNVVREQARQESRLRLLSARAAETLASDAPDPAEAAEARDQLRKLRDVCGSLPLPHAVIAQLRVAGLTRRQVASYVARWRPAGADETRRLWRQTLEMLRLAMAGVDLRRRFPRSFSEKNPWNTTPPPPSGITIGVGMPRTRP